MYYFYSRLLVYVQRYVRDYSSSFSITDNYWIIEHVFRFTELDERHAVNFYFQISTLCSFWTHTVYIPVKKTRSGPVTRRLNSLKRQTRQQGEKEMEQVRRPGEKTKQWDLKQHHNITQKPVMTCSKLE